MPNSPHHLQWWFRGNRTVRRFSSAATKGFAWVQTGGTAAPMDILEVTTGAAVPSEQGEDAHAVGCTTHLQGNTATPSYRFLNLVIPYASAPASDSVLWLLVQRSCHQELVFLKWSKCLPGMCVMCLHRTEMMPSLPPCHCIDHKFRCGNSRKAAQFTLC